MPWLLIKLSASPEQADAVTDALEACGAAAVTIEAASDEERLQSALEPTALWSANRVAGLFPENTDAGQTLAALRRELGVAELPPHSIDRLEDADWARAWMANYRPLQVAPRLWIVPTWCAPPDPDAINLFLDPGLAFGTGTHPTTALCLAWLATQSLQGRTIIDYGCGSGILAIAALKLGAAHAIGVDIDPQALTVSRENAARNGVAARYHACAPHALAADRRADIVVANILAGPLIELAPQLGERVGPGGAIALSGILAEQAPDVCKRYAAQFRFDTYERDGWVLLAGTRLP